MKILIVDDQPTNLKLLRLTLRSMGHQVVEAADGQEALTKLRSEAVDAIISDILMPNMDGYRFCFEVRNDPKLKGMLVLLYSSTYMTPSDRELALSFGADAFLPKPAPQEDIERALRMKSEAPAPSESVEDLGVLKKYSERLIRKIEEKNLELQKRTEELEESEKKFRQLAENILEAFWITDVQFSKTLYISPAYESIWGRTCEDLYRNPQAWIEAVHPEDRDRLLGEITLITADPGPFVWDYRIRRPDGSIRWIHDRGFPVKDSSGKIYRFAGVSEDVTERRSLESQLLQSQKMEAVGRLAGGVAHDFNNLLTAINGYSQLALSKLDTRDPLYGDLDEINKAGQRAAGLTRQLLAFSRKQILQARVVDLNLLLGETERLLKRLIGEDIELQTSFAPDAGRVHVDPGQIEQVILNLAVNARDAMPKGGILKIETANADLDASYVAGHPGLAPGAYVLMAVTDTGTGMTDHVKAHLFEPFFTTKEVGKGTGLGLATVHGIVKQSRGHIAVYSELGRGTVFKVYFPRTDAPAKTPSSSAIPKIKLGDQETILVVEDENVVRTLTRTVLVQAGYTVLEARRGAEALEIAERHASPIHLVVSDLIMPGMNGAQLMKALKARHPHVKGLFSSGYTDLSILREDDLDPTAPFLSKPFTPNALLLKVREVLDS